MEETQEDEGDEDDDDDDDEDDDAKRESHQAVSCLAPATGTGLQAASAWEGLVSFQGICAAREYPRLTFRQLGLPARPWVRTRWCCNCVASHPLPGGDVSWRVDALQDGQSINADTPARIPTTVAPLHRSKQP
jgi:hypothetical protein